ncbi:hypothetical protein AB5I41_23065 [Sphingomonas sp. MMS24-JH45]
MAPAGQHLRRRAGPPSATPCSAPSSRDVGGLASFTVGGKSYDAAQLDKCNAKAGVAVASGTTAPAVAN